MCGIIGAINQDLSQEDVGRLRHRGPDGSGLRVLRLGNQTVSLGHRRLAIVDLSEAGAQPMPAPEDAGCLVFNGEIYNHAGLRSLLYEYSFRGHSDTETLAYLFHKHGPECLGLLNGIFSLAYLDVPKQALYLARDPFGVKPLYWCLEDNRLMFSSEIRGLERFAGREISVESLGVLLRMRYLPSPLTMWKSIAKVPPGCFVKVDLRGERLRWEVKPYAKLDPPQGSDADCEAGRDYAAMVERAVARQLMSDVEVGLFLSGGLDSAITAAYARKQLGRSVRAYTVGYDETDAADEVQQASRIASSLGLLHRVVRINESSFVESFSDVADIVEEPIAASSMIPLYALARLASQDVKVVLSGQGADEILGGYSRYQAASAIAACRRLGIARPLAFIVRKFPACSPSVRIAEALALNGPQQACVALTQLFTRDEVFRLLGSGSAGDIPSFASQFRSAHDDFASSVMAFDARTNLPDELLMYTDKITMHFSLECRVPFLDLELADYVESIRRRSKVTVLSRKKLQHRLFRRLFPRVTLSRSKNGFFVPSTSWFGERARIRRLLLSRDGPLSQFFDMREVARVVADRDAGRKADKHLFMLASIALWIEKHQMRACAAKR